MKKISLLLVVLMILQSFLFSCKNSKLCPRIDNNAGNYETVSNVYKTNFITVPDEYNIYTGNPSYFCKDERIYFLCSYIDETDKANYNYNTTFAVYSFDTYCKNTELVKLEASQTIADGVFKGVDIYKISMLSNGNFIALCWDYDINQYVLITFASDGLLIYTTTIDNMKNIERYLIKSMVINGNNDVFIYIENDLYIIPSGEDTAIIIPVPVPYTVEMTSHNGTVFIVFNDGNVGDIYTVNVKEHKIERYAVITAPENIKSQSGYKFTYFGTGYDVYYKTTKGLYGYNVGEEEAKQLINWQFSDIIENRVNILSILSPETVLALSSNSLLSSYNELTILSKVSEDEIVPKIIIYIAYTDHPNTINVLTQAAARFNETNDKYRIVFKEYYQYFSNDTKNRPYEMLNFDIISGDIPDMIIIDTNMNKQYLRSYASKNLFVDLYNYFDSDQDISQDDILGSVKSSYEINDKLYHLPLSFKIDTLIGKSSNIGKESYMTIPDMLEMYDNLPDDVCLISTGFGGQYLLNKILQATIGDYIDYESGKCYFTNDEFISLLKFVKNYTVDDEYRGTIYGQSIASSMSTDSDYTITSSIIPFCREDKIYMLATTFDNIEAYILYKHFFGVENGFEDEIVFKGYPTKSSNGSIVCSDYSLGITETSACKEGAWEFIKYLMSDEIQSSKVLNSFGMPVVASALKTLLEQAQDYLYELLVGNTPMIPSLNNNVWATVRKFIELPDYIQSTPSNIYIYKLTKEDSDNIYNFLNSIEIRNKTDETVMNIVKEEVDIFWAGDITAEQCAKYIQNRVYIYVNEQR